MGESIGEENISWNREEIQRRILSKRQKKRYLEKKMGKHRKRTHLAKAT